LVRARLQTQPTRAKRALPPPPGAADEDEGGGAARDREGGHFGGGDGAAGGDDGDGDGENGENGGTPARRQRDGSAGDGTGERGEGVAGAYPPLAGNRAVTMAVPANLVRIVLEGGFAPATAGNPRPYGMPPFAQTFSNGDVAAVLTHLRLSWGNSAEAVTPLDVLRYRDGGMR
jgi:hypothetical protein